MGTNPIKDFKSVDLPTPFLPSKTVIFPAVALTLTPLRICEPP
jgi:hypothetical protein